MEPKLLLQQIWDEQADQTPNGEACRFQLQTESGPTEYHVCSRAVLLDYAPAKTLEPGKLFTANHLKLKKLQDASKVLPENMLCEESLTIHNDEDIEACFLPLNSWKETGLGVLTRYDDKVVLKTVMPYLKTGSFQFAGLALHYIADKVRWAVNKESSLTALNARIGKMRTGPVMVLLLSCDTALLVVTLSKIQPNNPLVNAIYLDGEDGASYRLDGLREDSVFYTRIVKGKNTLKGLANPVAKKATSQVVEKVEAPEQPTPVPVLKLDGPAATVDEVPQVEEVQPEQAEAIAEAAIDVSPPEQVKEEPAAEEPKKRTRAKRVKTAQDDAEKATGLLDEIIAYISAPIPDWMTAELMQAESRKLRDLSIAIARRQSNLFTAATASEKKLRDVLRGVLG